MPTHDGLCGVYLITPQKGTMVQFLRLFQKEINLMVKSESSSIILQKFRAFQNQYVFFLFCFGFSSVK